MKATKQNNIPLALKMIRAVFQILNVIAPPLADRLAVYLFFKPFRFKPSPPEKEMANTGDPFEFTVHDKTVKGFSWGQGEKKVLLVHGWSGRGLQFRKFINPLLNQGYQVITFDGPAHGFSDGNRTNIIEFKDTMLEIENRFGRINFAICHSFGGVAAFYGMLKGLTFKRIVIIGSPTKAEYLVNEYLERINGASRIKTYFYQYVRKNFGIEFDDFGIDAMAHRVKHPFQLLIIHDEEDAEVPVIHANHLNQGFPSELKITKGLGHNRILKDPGVIARSITFLKKNTIHKPETMAV